MGDLINLNCPNCGSQLKVESTKMKTTCQFCGTDILIKDFITARRVDKEDKLESYSVLIENAKRNKDYKGVYKYYNEVCKLEPSKENLMNLNLYGFYSGAFEFQADWLQDLYILPPPEHRAILDEMLSFVNKSKQQRIDKLPPNMTVQQKNTEICKINNEFAKTINALSAEIRRLKIKRCRCGAEIEYNEDICPQCGTSYSAYQRELTQAKKAKRKKIIKWSLIIGIPAAVVIVIFSSVFNAARVDKIHSEIKSGNYVAAESLIDEYQSSNSTRKEPYELYAELYLAQNEPEKAIEKLEIGIRKVSSSYKDDLQDMADDIKKEYQ